MSPVRERIQERFRNEICSVCIHDLPNGTCEQRWSGACPLLNRTDDLIAAVRQVEADHIDPYIMRVRETVCATCGANHDGICCLRSDLDCALELYLPLVVEIVKKELER